MSDQIITNQRQLRSDPKETLDLLGTILDEDAKRDAVHVAVIPVVAGCNLLPGYHVGLEGNKAYPKCEPHLGIVDPFIPAPILEGTRFFLFLYPRKILSLRHIWTHPEIPDEISPTSNVPSPVTDVAASELWLRQFVAHADCPDYDTLIRAAIGEDIGDGRTQLSGYHDYYSSHNDGEYLHFGGIDAHGDIPPEFWDHVEVVTGQRIPRENRATRFSCAC